MEAPPPATSVQMRPSGLSTVSFREAPVLESSSSVYASSFVRLRPKGGGNSIGPHLLPLSNSAVSSSSAAMSSGNPQQLLSQILWSHIGTNGLISRKV